MEECSHGRVQCGGSAQVERRIPQYHSRSFTLAVGEAVTYARYCRRVLGEKHSGMVTSLGKKRAVHR